MAHRQGNPSKPRRVQSEGTAVPDPSRTRILTAAEHVFCEKGFDAGTLRQVAMVADVPLSLITYHFGEKLALYRAVFEARVPVIVQQRLAGMALADLETAPERRLELLVKALLVPMLGLRATESGRKFAVLLAREIADPSSQGRGIVQELMHPVTGAFFSRMDEMFTENERPAAFWAYGAMIGAMLYMLAGAGRMVLATNGLVDPDDIAACTRQLVSIALAGFRR